MTAFDPFEDFGDIDEIAERLNDADAAVRRLAVIDLTETASADVLPHLLTAVADPDATVRLQVAIALSEFDAVEAAAGLACLAADQDLTVACAAADSLAELKDPATAEPILPLVTHASAFV
ncbi:MAG: HEAT repeat domain-containing protein, partial [Mesorhizobium sp.]